MKKPASRITQVLTLLTTAVFALGVLLVLLTGADRYRNLVDRGAAAYEDRTALQYLTTRVHQAQWVEAGTVEGCPVLILGETIDGVDYTTRVYCHDGWLRELYTLPGAAIPLSAGEPILEAECLELTLEGQLLTVKLDQRELFLHLPEGGEVGS